jgi:NAD(P)H-dependent FMN reductase
MRLTVYNGSPRGEGGNTKVLLDQFTSGFEAVPGNSFELFYLDQVDEAAEFVAAFGQAERVLLAFPLYADAMPGLVKAFIESLAPLCGREGNPALAFLVHSGFVEAIHSRYVERYLERLTSRLGCAYVGTIVKGGTESTRDRPAKANQKLFETLFQLGKTFGESDTLDPQLLRALAQPERLPWLAATLFHLLERTPLATRFWDRQLREHGAFEHRYAKPFVE